MPLAWMDAGLATPTLAAGLFLVSWWKAILFLPPFLAWAWVVSTIYDKDAAQWYLPRRRWNLIHGSLGALALVAAFLMPPFVPGIGAFLVAWSVMVAILIADLAIYYVARNRDERVPDGRKWSLDPAKLLASAGATNKKKKSDAATSTMVFKGPGGVLQVPEKETPEYELRTFAESMVSRALDQRASRLDIAVISEQAYGATIVVDGVRSALEQMPKARGIQVIDLFKRAAGLDIEDRRKRQRGDMQIGQTGASTIPVSISTIGASAGQRLTLTIDPVKQVSLKLADLGLHPNQMEDAKKLVAEPGGVVLLSAPSGNGRTATLYAMLRAHDAYTSNVQTVELEPQAFLEGVRSNVFDPAEGSEFSTTVRSILRRDPDVVGIADVPDAETAKVVAKGDSDRCRVYLSLKADDPLKAIQAFAQLVGDQKQAGNCLRGVIGQRLVRRLCHNCKVAVKPTPENLKKLGLPADTKQIHRKGGKVLIKDKEQICPVCAGSGYLTQLGVFEVHPLGPEERKLIIANDLTALRALFRQNKQQSLQQAALQHVIAGDTSIEEVVRILSGDGAAKAAPAADKPAPAKPAPAG
jgi:type II secretory ATPase GspE/PulE/Tfp pilus assembly ATPase PilB-like protein